MNQPVIYLDNNATTPIDNEVYEAMLPILKEGYGNPSSNYRLGYMAKQVLQDARCSVANLLNAQEEQVIFTSGATEANTTAIVGTCLEKKSKKHIITSSIEHPSVIEAFNYLEKHHGFEISYAPVNEEGTVNIQQLKKLITDKTSLIAVMMVNNEVGSIQPIQEIGDICDREDIHFHCDAVQGAGKLKIDTHKLKIDTLAISAHKFYGPKGVGCLYVRNIQSQTPLLHGGSQENGIRSGTENVAGIVGFGIASQNAIKDVNKNRNKIMELRNIFLDELSTKLTGWGLNGHYTVPSTLSLSFEGVRGEALAFALSKVNVCVSVASACSSSSSKLSYVLKAMGKSKSEIRSTIRVSLGKQNSIEEVKMAVNEISFLVKKLRSFSSECVVTQGKKQTTVS